MKAESADIVQSTFDRIELLNNWGQGPRIRMVPTLAPMRDLMTRLGNPHHAFAVVHVTGTKGKGSVCALIEAALHSAGVRVGRYASPHVHSICERVSIGRRNVDKYTLARALERVLDARDEACAAGTPAKDATWFDAITAAAFLIFAHERLEWVVVEVGLGGRLDSTNVIDGRICVITNIALEHTEVLGNTLLEIAREKGGIIKNGAVVVTGVGRDCAAHAVLASLARAREAKLVTIDPQAGITRHNVELAGAALDRLGILCLRDATASPIGRALLDESTVRSARLPGRIELGEITVADRPVTVVLDGAHVDIALRALLEELANTPLAIEPVVVLFALGRDKNPRNMLRVLHQRAKHIVFAPLDAGNCWRPEQLATMARELGISSIVASDIPSALDTSCNLVGERGWILATGSLHLIAPVRQACRSKVRGHEIHFEEAGVRT